MKKISDLELLVNISNNDKDSFELLYKRHIQSLYNFGNKFTSQKELVNDSIQELFIDLWNRRNAVQEILNIRVYLIKSTRNILLKKLKKNKNNSRIEHEHLFLQDETSNQTKEFLELQKIAIKTCMGELSHRQREAIHLKYYHNLTNDEIAEILDVNYQSATNLIFRSLTKLKKVFQKSIV